MDSLILTLGNILPDGINVSMTGDGNVNLQLDIKPAVVTGSPDLSAGTVKARPIKKDSAADSGEWDGDEQTLLYAWCSPESAATAVSAPSPGDIGLIVGSKYFVSYSNKATSSSYTVSALQDNKIQLPLTVDSAPIAVRTSSGNYYILEKGSIHNTGSSWLIDPAPYLAYDNSSSFSGSWVIYMTGGERGGNSTSEFDTNGSMTYTMTSGEYMHHKKDAKLTSLILNINKDSNNSCICFNTDSEFTYTINISDDSNFYLGGGAHDFSPNSSYIVAVDNMTIVWSALEKYE